MKFDNSEPELQSAVDSILKIPIIPTILDVISRTTGMGFVAVARVTEDRWITCSSLDNLQFGLKPGDELKVITTICNEIRQCEKPVVIDHVALDEHYRQHHTPLMYGFQSYISMPIICKDGSFFGTLCAIDPAPAKLDTPEVTGMFSLFCDLISFHLDAVEKLEKSDLKLLQEREERIQVIEQKNEELEKMNKELTSFTYIASHDLQEPLRKITTFSSYILEQEYVSLSARGKNQFDRLLKSVKRMQQLIDDLLMYTRLQSNDSVFAKVALETIIEQVMQDFKEEITQNEVQVEYGPLCSAFVIPFQFNQLIQNLFGNAIKFSRKNVSPIIRITSIVEKGDPNVSEKLSGKSNYCHITITDNGIGFDKQYNQKIFEIFQRLHGKEEYEGTGIGLSIVKKIVDNHNGYITATGQINQGARFDIYLPHAEVEAPVAKHRSEL